MDNSSTFKNARIHASELEQLKQLEEEQEQLNSSLLALTTHFAQVQFRLKQIVSADQDDKEKLLKELEEFAFKGIPDSDKEHEVKITQQREKQRQLIDQLKSQLEDLETYAYETGDVKELPTNQMMEKQKVIIDQLRHKLDLDLENFHCLTTEELRHVVDHAVGQIVNPAKVKEKLVDQLKTQITDLERFIDFLQGEATSPGPLGKERCLCPMHHGKYFPDDGSGKTTECCIPHKGDHKPSITDKSKKKRDIHEMSEFMKKTVAILQMFLISQFGCGSREFKRNLLKKTTKGNHWGDLRAKLEVAIDKVLELGKEEQEKSDYSVTSQTDYTSDSEESQEQSSPALTQAVRKDLSMAIRDLMEHGLMEHGREYNDSPARKLSQSFHLEIVGGKPITAKQTLLGAVDTVISSHTPLKRTEDSHFKAFISLALKLPVDLAVRPFSNIKDAF
ncbi:hypothetical protein KUTeg_023284 [Tegillarca granosa]|uniref:RUN domain-containing protein n=1 Tax=Tegillarca granosa TaxID=220873 RepID=A0ABQ9E171_TEGGR|nr:hypothetical protein KUTeg_023284 [Tegillarca granosa]